ncbi:hypothetical protein QE152_g35041 [Popillia japonica]|uniref:DUF4219 domain-containing protein n=1 Tax=Popillia japonica TaxID=7064 RepID=A0AAW1IT47_POPJA
MSLLSTIEKLKGTENYSSWVFEVRAYLEHEGLWRCVTGEESDQTKLTQAKSRCVTGEESDQTKLTQAKSKLILLVDKINHHHILQSEDAKTIWNTLKEAFDDNGLTRRIGLLRSLLSTKLVDCASMDVYDAYM